MANILLSEECVKNIYRLIILLDGIDDPAIEELRGKIEKEIESKIEARKKREAFSKYKNSEQGSIGREAARNEYLDQVFIKKDWRSSKEIREE